MGGSILWDGLRQFHGLRGDLSTGYFQRRDTYIVCSSVTDGQQSQKSDICYIPFTYLNAVLGKIIFVKI